MTVAASIAAAREEREANRKPLTLKVSGFEDLPGVEAPLYVRYGRVSEDVYRELRRRMSLPQSHDDHVGVADGDRTLLVHACRGIFVVRDGEGVSPIPGTADLPTFADPGVAEWVGVEPAEPACNRVRALYFERPAEVSAHAGAVLSHSGLVPSVSAGVDVDPFATT